MADDLIDSEALSAEEQKAMEGMQSQDSEDKRIILDDKLNGVPDPAKQTQQQTRQAHQQQVEQPPKEPTEPREPREPVTVPVSEVQDERKRRQAAEQREADGALKLAKMEERLEILRNGGKLPEQQQTQQQRAQEIPDPEKNAMEALKYVTDFAKQQQATQQNEHAQREMQRQVRELGDEGARLEQEYLTTMPDYDAATKTSADYNAAGQHLKNARSMQLTAMGYTPQQVIHALTTESLGLIEHAKKLNVNPAKLVYDLAKTFGYNGPSTSIENAQPPSNVDKLSRIKEGQRANLSLGSVSSTPAPKEPSGRDIASMSDEDFDNWYNSMPEEKRRGYMGI